MKILVASSSKHGSTREIAEVIGHELRALGHDVEVHDTKNAPAASTYQAAIIGSALYMGSWMAEATTYLEQNDQALRAMPVWLFSSGPVGPDAPKPEDDFQKLPELMERSGAREHRTFVGKLDRNALGVFEKLIIKLVKAPYGDFRDWDAIRTWASAVANELATIQTAAA